MTREEAIKWLEEAINDTNNDFDLCSDALKKELLLQKDVFEMAVSALKFPQGEWISVEDRPPDTNGTYIVYAPTYYGGSSSGLDNINGIMFARRRGRNWSIEVGYHKRPNCVTHWMPLPEPPKDRG